MDGERPPVIFRRIAKLAEKFRNKAYRHSYVASHTRQFLAHQMRALRGEKSQTEFAKLLGTSQSIVSSRLEDPNYGKWTLQTLFDIAAKLDVAVLVRFVEFPMFLMFSDDMSQRASRPQAYSEGAIHELTDEVGKSKRSSALEEIFKSSAQPRQDTDLARLSRPASYAGPFPERQQSA